MRKSILTDEISYILSVVNRVIVYNTTLGKVFKLSKYRKYLLAPNQLII